MSTQAQVFTTIKEKNSRRQVVPKSENKSATTTNFFLNNYYTTHIPNEQRRKTRIKLSSVIRTATTHTLCVYFSHPIFKIKNNLFRLRQQPNNN